MNRNDRLVLERLQKKIIQHEETIAQLVKIVAFTNKRMMELLTEHQENSRELLIK